MSSPKNSPPASPDASLAETMGFSSFGSKPNPKKKRKLHQPAGMAGSGSNSLPLGGGRAKKEKYQFGDGQGMKGGAQFLGREIGDDGIANPGAAEGIPDQDGTEAVPKPTSSDAYSKPQPVRESTPANMYSEDGARQLHPQSHLLSLRQEPLKLLLPARPELSSFHSPVPPIHAQRNPNHDFIALCQGIRDERGDMAYYDASFVEDPWRGLIT